MNKIDIIELIKTLIKLRLTNASHRIVVGLILIILSIWGIGSLDLGKCNEKLLILPSLLGLFLILSNLLSSDKSKKSITTRIFDIVFIFSFTFSIFFLLFDYFNCAGLRQLLITPSTNNSIEMKDCRPKSATKLISKVIIKEVEKEPKNIYNTNLNYVINIYESTDSLSKNPFYIANIDYSLSKVNNDFFTNFMIGMKKIYFNFNLDTEFNTLNEIEKNIEIFVYNLSIQRDSLRLDSENQFTKQINFEGNLNDWNAKVNEYRITQQDNYFKDLGYISLLKRKVNILENKIFQLQNTSQTLKGGQAISKSGQAKPNEDIYVTPKKIQVLDSCAEINNSLGVYTHNLHFYTRELDSLHKKIYNYQAEMAKLKEMIIITERLKQKKCPKID